MRPNLNPDKAMLISREIEQEMKQHKKQYVPNRKSSRHAGVNVTRSYVQGMFNRAGVQGRKTPASFHTLIALHAKDASTGRVRKFIVRRDQFQRSANVQ